MKLLRKTNLIKYFYFSYYIEQTTAAAGSAVPDVPYFNIERANSENGFGKAKVVWQPNYSGVPGSHFYVEHRKKGKSTYESSKAQISDDTIEVGGLDPDEEYEFRVVSVDGNFETPSAVQRFDTTGGGLFES